MEKTIQNQNGEVHLPQEIKTDPLFRLIDVDNQGYITLQDFLAVLNKVGFYKDDPRVKKALFELHKARTDAKTPLKVTPALFRECLSNNVTLINALTQNLIIPEFEEFQQDILEIYEATKKNTGGKVADYIPQLARVNPEQYAISICTIDGQRLSIGDAYTNFCLQSTCKPINYCLAIEEFGEEKVHQHVGREPSGRSFNELSLNTKGLPHNPLINSGAIMCASLIKPKLDMADRFDYVFQAWHRLCGLQKPSFNNAVYLSERQTADRNFALAYFMRENNAFPEKTNLVETLEFYFQCCSIESCSHNLAVAAATLANAGTNPLTGENIFEEKTVQHCMSLMSSCGMYDFSGEFAFKIGMPAKSGVSGGLMIVIPNLMGISVWSPRLDKHGNSVRGVEFCERLIEKYNFHIYDSLNRGTSKKNPRKHKYEEKTNNSISLIYAANHGDLNEIKRLEALGLDLSQADYDGRTALHLAAAENQIGTVKYLISRGVQLDAVDRWGGTPLDDAKKGKHKEVIDLLKKELKEVG